MHLLWISLLDITACCYVPTTAVSMLTIRSNRSFFQVGQLSGSRGDSLGWGTRTMSLFRPLACFNLEVSRPRTP